MYGSSPGIHTKASEIQRTKKNKAKSRKTKRSIFQPDRSNNPDYGPGVQNNFANQTAPLEGAELAEKCDSYLKDLKMYIQDIIQFEIDTRGQDSDKWLERLLRFFSIWQCLHGVA